MNDQHPSAKADREYGELYYRADAVAAILRVVADMVEGDKRMDVLRISSSIPSTMPWDDNCKNSQHTTREPNLYCFIQFWLQQHTLLGGGPIRLDALLRRGPSPVRAPDGEHFAGVADQQSDAAA